ncbi:MAG TPA: pyridoxal-phosphate dependent enzyme [Candidatus Paceibacterota bacterium]|nr:pyridoxal-phosphate dependent enzyme [Candidatus Paceibacterota bacterium]
MKKSRLSLEEVLAHPMVEALNPYHQDFISLRWLSSNLNPFRLEEDIDIAAAITFGTLPHIKTVAAFGMLKEDFENGVYEGIDTLVVPSSGNTAHAVALLAPAFGIPRVKLIMSSDTPESKQSVIRMLPQASVMNPDGKRSVEDVAFEESSRPGHHLLDQYKHLGNVLAHRECTGPQLLNAAGEGLGLVAVSMGSGGTVTGISQYLKSKDPNIIVIGVRPSPGQRVPGVRDLARMNAVVSLPYREAVDDIVELSREESFQTARDFMSEVYPTPGPSSGLAYAGLKKYLREHALLVKSLRGKKALFVCPDDVRFYSAQMASTIDY